MITPHDIIQALRLFFNPGDVFEIRALGASTPGYRREHIESGYFDYEHVEDVPKALENITARGIYFTPNPVNPVLLARTANRIKPAGKDETTSDKDILSRRWLLIDCDAIRPAKISASEEEHDAALYKAIEIKDGLKSMGWPDPVFLDSGNGAQLMYSVNLPRDDNDLVQSCLNALASVNDDKVHIDQAVFNPSRIWRLPGTMNRKGDEIDDRVYRMAKIVEAPDNLDAVPEGKLKELAPKSTPKEAPLSVSDSFDLDSWISQYCPEAEGPTSWKDGRKWIFPVCPFNPEHANRSAVITQQHNGAIGFRCLHNSCLNNDWKALRSLKEPEKIPVTLPSVDLSAILARFQKEETKKVSLLLPVNAAEWIKVKLPPPVPIIKDFIDKGNKIQLLGDSKLGKSWFNLNLALSIATGRNFLHWKIPHPRKVLLVQLEIGAVYYQDRLKLVSKAMGIADEDLCNLSIINGRGLPPLMEGEIFYEFLEVVTGYDVVFIDPLYKVHSGDENKVEDMKRPLLAFDRICEIGGAAVIYTHHNPKGLSGDRKLVDRGSGSAVLSRDYDGMISLSPHAQDGLLVLEALTRNHPKPRAFTLIRDGLFRIVDIEPEELTSNTANERKKMTLLEAMVCVKDAEIIHQGELLRAEEVDDRLVSICDLPVRMARTVRAEMVRQKEWEIETGERNAKLYKCREIL